MSQKFEFIQDFADYCVKQYHLIQMRIETNKNELSYNRNQVDLVRKVCSLRSHGVFKMEFPESEIFICGQTTYSWTLKSSLT